MLASHCISYPHNAPARARTRCDTPRYRCAVEFGEQRLLAPKRVCFLRIRLPAKAPLFQKAQNPPVNAVYNAGDFGITRRPSTHKRQFALGVFHVNAVHGHNMEMRIKIQGVAETLNEADRAAARLAV